VNPTRPLVLLRAEGIVLLVGAVWGYRAAGGSWLLFVLLVMLPDLSMIGYLVGPRVGAAVYNTAHTALLPAALVGIGVWLGHDTLLLVGLVWLAHIGLDRALGYGLKDSTGFADTHLLRGGRARQDQKQAA
jgi:hypothetical protein